MGVNGFLFDTHAVVWAINEPDRLGPRALSVLADPSLDLVISAASVWELATKHRIGKLPGMGATLSSLDSSVQRLRARTLSISPGHAVLAEGLEWGHRDPFDRMLAAQAITESLVLVTRDGAFRQLPQLVSEW